MTRPTQAAIRLAIISGFCLVLVSTAGALTIGDTHDLGLISKNYPANPTSSAGYINTLLDQPLGSGPVLIGDNTYTRTMNDPLRGNYPDAVFQIDLGVTTTINLSTGALYLLAKYDGPNWGSEIWYVGDLSGTVTIPEYATKNKKYGVSHVFLYGGSLFAGRPVPETGSAAGLLGCALIGLFALHRFICSLAEKRR